MSENQQGQKDLPQEFEQFVEEIKKVEKQVTKLCDSQELSLSKAKEISELYLQPIEYPIFWNFMAQLTKLN